MINDFENHMVEVDDVMVKWCVKRKVRVPPRGTLTLRLTHHLTITSSTSAIWFSRSLSHMASHMGFKVNHMVQGKSYGLRSTMDQTYAMPLAHSRICVESVL